MISAFELLALSRIPRIGAHRLRALVTHFGGTSALFGASAREISAAEGFTKRLASEVVHFMRHEGMEEARRYAGRQLSVLNKVNGSVVSYWEERYPAALKTIYDPPPFLFAAGEYAPGDRYALAIVGTRVPSPYGLSVAEAFSSEFARRGLTVVSGLARGIDTAAHAAALKSGGRTMAAIGSGLDVPYPPENGALSRRIAAHGLLLSEYPMGAKPDAVNFPRRNRIISGLSLGTVVIETGINGGAMITANLALEQGREVFAVPGNIGSKRSGGCNELIRTGRAKLVESVDDVLVELAPKLPPPIRDQLKAGAPAPPDLTLFERRVFDQLREEPSHIDDLALASRLPAPDLLVNLLSLEFKGLARQLPGKRFARI